MHIVVRRFHIILKIRMGEIIILCVSRGRKENNKKIVGKIVKKNEKLRRKRKKRANKRSS